MSFDSVLHYLVMWKLVINNQVILKNIELYFFILYQSKKLVYLNAQGRILTHFCMINREFRAKSKGILETRDEIRLNVEQEQETRGFYNERGRVILDPERRKMGRRHGNGHRYVRTP